MDAVIERRLSSEVALIGQISRYIVAAGGKRLRPALLLLMCGALGYKGEQRFNLAAVVEFIHTATLLHDDVVDESTLRRGRETANEAFGNPASVLVGDFLYSRAFQMMVDAGDMRIMRTLAEATNVIAEGEVQQLMNMHDAGLSEDEYVRVIRSKTAKLFEASARLAALLALSSPEVEAACAGDVSEMGKNLGDDLREGKVTLPLIIAMQRGTEVERQTLQQAIETGDTSKMVDILAIVQRTGALEATLATAAVQAQIAVDALSILPDTAYRQALMQLAAQLLNRRA
jgi:octaprenyl-diphosphate synthase